MRKAPLVFVLVLGFSTLIAHGQGSSQRLHLHLDPASTEVHFTLKDTIHTVHGTFRMAAGDINFDPITGDAQGRIEVDAGSGASGNDTRDGKMKKDYLEVVKFPVATFEPHKVTGFNASAGIQTISVLGDFTLHGVAHQMTMQFSVASTGGQTTASSSFKIPYVSWGIKDPSIPFVKVEKEVTIDIAAKGTLKSE